MIRSSSLFLFFLLWCACGSKNEIVNGSIEYRPKGFELFPDTLFEGLYMEMSSHELKSILTQKNFVMVDSSTSLVFVRNIDSSQILTNKGEMLTEFKVYLKSNELLSQRDEMMSLFYSFASEKSVSSEYSIYYFNDAKKPFKLTFFSQPEYIRLNFEKQKSY